MFKKRLITISALPFVTALLLGSSLIISNKPGKVSAISDTHEHNGWTGVTELPTEAGNYYLTDNITLTETWTVPEGTTNFCLNDFVIKLADGSTGNVIKVLQNATLNLYDCGTTEHNGYVDSTGLWHYDSTGTHELLEGETAKAIAGGIITGGNNNSSSGNGGGVQVDRGKFYLYGGNIVGNYAKNGAGVQVGSKTEGVIASFEMSGGTISYNKALNGGGGVSISNKYEEFNMMGGEITNNVVNSNFGGGVLTQNYITLGGTAKITGNTANGATNNLYLYGKTITLGRDNDAPTTMSVGVTTSTAPTEDNSVKITVDDAADYSANFFSDSNNYKVCFNNSGTDDYLELRRAYLITNNTKEVDKETNNGYIEVKESAINGEKVSINVVPNAGYKLKSLVYNDGADHYITTELSFEMQTTPVSVTAEFEAKAEQVIEIGDISKIYDDLPINFDQYSSALSYLGDGEVTIEFKVADASDETYTTDRPVNAGEYTVRVSVAESSTHSAGVKTKNFTISCAKINKVGFGDISQPVAGKTAPTIVGGIATGAKYTGSISWSPALVDGKFDCKTTYMVTITLDIVPSSIKNYVFAEDVVLVKPNSEGWAKSTDSTDKKLIYTKEFEPTADHSVNKINGTNATCTEDGFKDAYQCETCGLYYEDEVCSELIGDETAYNEWILGDGKISASGHSMTHHEAVAPTCTQDGNVEYWICSHESGVYYADEQGTSTLTSIVVSKLGHDIIHHDAKAPSCTEVGWEAYDTCSRCDYSTKVEIPALGHSLSEAAGKLPTCTEDGYMVAYKCSTCEMYFTDPAGEHKIGDETAYNAWKLNEGKIQARHVVSKVSGVDPTKERSGYKEAWKCSECGQYFEDEACTILIGDETAYNAWKSARGYLPQLPNEGLSGGAISGICVGSIFLLLLVIYLIGYFFLYRKGKLDEKKIKVIYKFLPRGEKNLKEDDK